MQFSQSSPHCQNSSYCSMTIASTSLYQLDDVAPVCELDVGFDETTLATLEVPALGQSRFSAVPYHPLPCPHLHHPRPPHPPRNHLPPQSVCPSHNSPVLSLDASQRLCQGGRGPEVGSVDNLYATPHPAHTFPPDQLNSPLSTLRKRALWLGLRKAGDLRPLSH